MKKARRRFAENGWRRCEVTKKLALGDDVEEWASWRHRNERGGVGVAAYSDGVASKYLGSA